MNEEERINREVERRLNDPAYLRNKVVNLVAQIEDLRGQVEEIYENREDYSMARVAEKLKIPYFPQGEAKMKAMGQNILHLLFMHDGIIVDRGAEGYRLAKAYQDRGYGRTVENSYKTRSGQIRVSDSVVFNGKGIELLIKKYREDSRTFRTERWAGYLRLKVEE